MKTHTTAISTRPRIAAWLQRIAEEGILIPAAFLAILLAIYAAKTPGAFDPASLRYSLYNASLALVLVSAGLALVVMVGGLDLSLAGVIAVVNAILTVHYGGGLVTQILWLIGIVALSGAFGAINGFIVHQFELEPVVVTLAGGFILTGAALLILPEPAGLAPVPGTSLVLQMTGAGGGLSVSFLIILLVAVAWFVLRRSKLGTWMMAVGGDREGAAYSGVPVGRTRVTVFAMAGALYGVAGVAVTSQTSGGDAKLGSSYLLASFAAVVVGGVRLGGGSGSVFGVIFGAMAIAISVSVLLSLGFDSYWSTIARGVFLLLAIGAQAALVLLLRRLSRRAKPIQIGALP